MLFKLYVYYVKRGMLMMENLTHAETRIGNNRLKLFGIKNSWMVRVLFEKSSIRPTKRGQRPKLTFEVT